MFEALGRAGLVAVLTIGGLVLAAPVATAGADTPPCHARDLAISKAGQEGAAGSRYLDIEVTNVSDTRCRLTGFPTFTWRRHGHDIGWSSVPESGQTAHTVAIRPGHAAYTTLHWTDPGPVPPTQCRARTATALRMTLPHRPHVYRIPLKARVCTTKQYRPTAFPVRGTAAVS
jgi:hypothetical protein